MLISMECNNNSYQETGYIEKRIPMIDCFAAAKLSIIPDGTSVFTFLCTLNTRSSVKLKSLFFNGSNPNHW